MTCIDDKELNALIGFYSCRWHVTRNRSGVLDAAREPDRLYHVVALSGAELAGSINLAERQGSLVRRGA